MSTVLFYIIVAAKRTMYAFGLCFCVWVLFTSVLKREPANRDEQMIINESTVYAAYYSSEAARR